MNTFERMTKRAAISRMSSAKFTKAHIVRYLADNMDLLPDCEQNTLLDAVAILRRDAGIIEAKLTAGEYDHDTE